MKKVFIVTPSCLIKKKATFTRAIKQICRLNFHIVNPRFPTVLPSPQEKADQLHRAFADPEIDVILALRGGYGAMKSLPYLDFDLIDKHRKVFAGFSDVSAFLNPVYERTGLMTLHSPMVTNLDEPTPFTIRSFINALDGYPEKNLLRGAPVKVYNPGTATGVLKGGNLATLTALIGTEWEIDTIGAVLFLEDVDEKLHGVDRYLTQWIFAGKFKDVQALVLGDFRGIKSSQVYNILASQMEITFPVIHCPYIGHVKKMITLPVGAEVELNTDCKQMVIRQMSCPWAKG